MSSQQDPRPPPSEGELEAARKIIATAESAARHILSEAAVVAAELKAVASNGYHDQLRADIKIVHDEVIANRKTLDSLSECVLGLQRNSLRMLGLTGLFGGVLIFALSRALGL